MKETMFDALRKFRQVSSGDPEEMHINRYNKRKLYKEFKINRNEDFFGIKIVINNRIKGIILL